MEKYKKKCDKRSAAAEALHIQSHATLDVLVKSTAAVRAAEFPAAAGRSPPDESDESDHQDQRRQPQSAGQLPLGPLLLVSAATFSFLAASQASNRSLILPSLLMEISWFSCSSLFMRLLSMVNIFEVVCCTHCDISSYITVLIHGSQPLALHLNNPRWLLRHHKLGISGVNKDLSNNSNLTWPYGSSQ